MSQAQINGWLDECFVGWMEEGMDEYIVERQIDAQIGKRQMYEQMKTSMIDKYR